MLGQWSDGIPCLPDGLCWGRGGIKYLGVYLADDSFYRRIGRGCWKKSNGAWINGNGYYQIYHIEGGLLLLTI